jgi:hypothetical protein
LRDWSTFSERDYRNATTVEHRTIEQIKRNNEIFREANESIRDAAQRHAHELDRIPFLCECPVEGCVEVVRLTSDEYGAIRAQPQHFLTAVGHEESEAPAGEVVARHDGYVVVEKR